MSYYNAVIARVDASSDVRSALLDAAARLFAAEGPEAFTVRRLAQEVGTSTMAVYSRFSGKDDLVAAMANDFVTRFTAALRAVPASDDALAHFVDLGHAYRAISMANPHLYRVAMQSGRLSPLEDIPAGSADIFAYTAEVLGRCVEQGAFPPGEPVALLVTLWTAVHGQVSLELEQVFPSQEAADAAWDTLLWAILVGLGADPTHVDHVRTRCSPKGARRRTAPAGHRRP